MNTVQQLTHIACTRRGYVIPLEVFGRALEFLSHEEPSSLVTYSSFSLVSRTYQPLGQNQLFRHIRVRFGDLASHAKLESLLRYGQRLRSYVQILHASTTDSDCPALDIYVNGDTISSYLPKLEVLRLDQLTITEDFARAFQNRSLQVMFHGKIGVYNKVINFGSRAREILQSVSIYFDDPMSTGPVGFATLSKVTELRVQLIWSPRILLNLFDNTLRFLRLPALQHLHIFIMRGSLVGLDSSSDHEIQQFNDKISAMAYPDLADISIYFVACDGLDTTSIIKGLVNALVHYGSKRAYVHHLHEDPHFKDMYEKRASQMYDDSDRTGTTSIEDESATTFSQTSEVGDGLDEDDIHMGNISSSTLITMDAGLDQVKLLRPLAKEDRGEEGQQIREQDNMLPEESAQTLDEDSNLEVTEHVGGTTNAATTTPPAREITKAEPVKDSMSSKRNSEDPEEIVPSTVAKVVISPPEDGQASDVVHTESTNDKNMKDDGQHMRRSEKGRCIIS